MGLKKLTLPKLPEKRNPEQVHFDPKNSDSYCFKGGLKTYSFSNKETNKEHTHKELMGSKKLVPSLNEMRNHIGVASLGDKPYKNPEYSTNFKPQIYRLKFSDAHPANKNSKIIDYYKDLDLDKFINMDTGMAEKKKQRKKQKREMEVKQLDDWYICNVGIKML